MDCTVKISWFPGSAAGAENAEQAQCLADSLRTAAAALESEASGADVQRQHLNPDSENGRLGMIYVDQRTESNRAQAQELRATADRLEASL